jgi:FKBP-type peptidyl-prolyl cis-trans isomerase FklB
MKHCPIAAADVRKMYAAILFLFLAVITVHAKAIQEDINLEDEKAMTSYAFGMTVGSGLKQAELELDYPAFTEGLRKTMENGQTPINQDEALEIVQSAFENAMKKQSAKLRAKEENFLTENALNDAVITTPSGLQYMVLVQGDGPRPAPDDIVQVHYEGTLIDGTVFDSSYHSEKGEEIPLDMVIPGWAEGLLLMNVGSKHRIYIPSSLAYGERGAGQVIPSYSTLIFTIELLEIIKRNDEAETWDQ